MERYALETIGLAKRYGARVAVDGVSLTVPYGSVYGFLGPNGAGKTTLIRMLLGLAEASAGSFRLLGENGTAALGSCGAIVEEPRFHGHLTGRENLAVAAASRPGGASARIGVVLERVGLADRADDRVSRYSLGMRQRLGIARALLSDPRLLILDEPSNGLDPAGIAEMRTLLRSFALEGRTVFVSSHQLDEIEKVCDHVAIIRDGRIVAQGAIDMIRAGVVSTVRVDCDRAHEAATIAAGLGFDDVIADETGFHAAPAAFEVPDLVATLVADGIRIRGVAATGASLEQAFLDLTNDRNDTPQEALR